MAGDHDATEYGACQSEIATIDMRLWQSAAILIGASFAALALLAREEPSTEFCIGLAVATAAATVVFGLWARIWLRRDASVGALETRMREIEWRTGMRKVIYMEILRQWGEREKSADWKRLSPEERAALTDRYGPWPTPSATYMLGATALIALLGWPLLTIAMTLSLVVD